MPCRCHSRARATPLSRLGFAKKVWRGSWDPKCRLPLGNRRGDSASCDEGSQEPPLRQADDIATSDDQVIEDPDVDQRERLFDTLGDQLIGLTRLGNSGRMVVSVMCP